jgi:hypothetical protein
MYIISKQNHAEGIPYLGFKEGYEIYRAFQAARG